MREVMPAMHEGIARVEGTPAARSGRPAWAPTSKADSARRTSVPPRDPQRPAVQLGLELGEVDALAGEAHQG